MGNKSSTRNQTTSHQEESKEDPQPNKEESKENTSTLQDAVKLSAQKEQCKDKLKQLLGECTNDNDLIQRVVNFFEKTRKSIESSPGTIAIAGALGLTVLEASPKVGQLIGTHLSINKLGVSALVCGAGTATAVGAFTAIAIITTGCLLFQKYRIMKQSQEIKEEILKKLKKLNDDMHTLLEECSDENFAKISKNCFKNLQRQIDELYICFHDIVEKLEKQRKKLNRAKWLIGGISSIVVVTGIIFCATGVGAAIGGPLIACGATGLYCAYTLHRAEQEIKKEIEFYRTTFRCIEDLEFILHELETLQNKKLINTKEKFKKKLDYLKKRNKNLFDEYLKKLEQEGLLQDGGLKIYIPEENETLIEKKKSFKTIFKDLDEHHEEHLWVVVKEWIESHQKTKSLFDAIFNERKKNIGHNQQNMRSLRNNKN